MGGRSRARVVEASATQGFDQHRSERTQPNKSEWKGPLHITRPPPRSARQARPDQLFLGQAPLLIILRRARP